VSLRHRSRRELTSDRIGRSVLVLLGAYVLITFGWRTVLQWRRTGDLGVRVSRQSPIAAKTASALMISGSVVGLWSVAGVARGRKGPYRLPPILRRAGVAILTGAGVLTTRAQLDLGRSWRIGVDESERTELVTEGSFGVVRNPIFSGMGLAVVGAGLAVPTPATWLAAVALLTGVEMQVRAVEEPYLLRTHGAAYRDYGRRTGRFAPGIGRLR
jgi:protein-S-isoprenylcysteine O-methyltransferase Ste14